MRIAGALAAAYVAFSGVAAAQPAPRMPAPLPAQAPASTGEVPLYPDLKTGSPSTERWVRFGDHLVVRNVTYPTITPVLPAPGKATGAAVVVAPGGGFMLLAMDDEAWPVAHWLADHGVAAFVLKYRTNPTPEDHARAFAEMGARIAAANSDPAAQRLVAPHAADDALAAVRLVRAQAGRWGVDPQRVGMIGFSAGAITTLKATLDGKPEERPAFIGYIYGRMDPVAVPADAPPMFVALANDDPLMGGRGFGVVDAWIKARRPVELHAYQSGGHGFGAGRPGTDTDEVMPEFHEWMQNRGLLGPAGAAAAR